MPGRPRPNLFYRLKVIAVTLPPLRERREDILPLAEHFLERYRRPLGKAVHGFTAEAVRRLLAHPWPGNVRELEACVQRAVTLTRNAALTAEDLFPEADAAHAAAPAGNAAIHPLAEAIHETERRYLQAVLASVGGQRKRAAAILGISRKTLWKDLKQLRLEWSAAGGTWARCHRAAPWGSRSGDTARPGAGRRRPRREGGIPREASGARVANLRLRAVPFPGGAREKGAAAGAAGGD